MTIFTLPNLAQGRRHRSPHGRPFRLVRRLLNVFGFVRTTTTNRRFVSHLQATRRRRANRGRLHQRRFRHLISFVFPTINTTTRRRFTRTTAFRNTRTLAGLTLDRIRRQFTTNFLITNGRRHVGNRQMNFQTNHLFLSRQTRGTSFHTVRTQLIRNHLLLDTRSHFSLYYQYIRSGPPDMVLTGRGTDHPVHGT